MSCDHPEPTEGDVTEIEVVGADCPWCLNDTLDRLRTIDGVTGVHASMTGRCIQVLHHQAHVPSLLAVVRTTLHGTSTFSNELEMVAIDPHVAPTSCAHGTPHPDSPPSLIVRGGRPMETLTDAIIRLKANGYRHEFSATDTGDLECGQCGISTHPEEMSVRAVVRFEGDSNPDDEAILVAMACRCGCLGQYSAAFGPTTPRVDAEVLQRLPFPSQHQSDG
jgi:hypothetical protein